MTTPQILSVSLVAVMMAAFLWGRLRYDIVAMLALLAGVAVGIVPAKEAFTGFSDDIVIIVGSALVLSAAVARSRVIERVLARLAPRLGSTQAQVAMLVVVVAVMSAIIKNIGALAMMLPIAYQLARKGGRSPSVFLMPMAFASLLGGIVTLVGTSPNVIVARVRAELGGEPFSMFDFTPVGIAVALAGCAFLAVGYRLLPMDRRGAVSLDQAIDIKDYVTEARIRAKSVLAGKQVADLKAIGGDDLQIVAILRNERRLQAPLPDASLKAGDTLLLR
ncbi:MAG TPA: SLC13 family permease, partial [Bosea sp. (in: a-proteobacteria)]